MPKISDGQIAAYARSAGVSGANVAIAVAIAIAESGGNTTAHNALPPDNSYGLWQINMLGSMGPSRRASLGISSNEALFDPGTNARAMAMLSGGGTNWKPWTTYTRGTYRLYMSRGQSASGTSEVVPAGTNLASPVGLGDTLENLTKAIETLSDPQMWKRIGLALGGVLLLALGLVGATGVQERVQMAAKIIGAVK